VGYSISGTSGRQALRWDASGVATELAHVGPSSEALHVSGDGLIVAGEYDTPSGETHACIWDAAGTLTDIHPATGGDSSTVIELSHDGSTAIVRNYDITVGEFFYFVWSASTGTFALPELGAATILPQGLSADGSAVVGRMSFDLFGDHGTFYWSSATGYLIGDPEVGEPSKILISGDGNVIYGVSELSFFSARSAHSSPGSPVPAISSINSTRGSPWRPGASMVRSWWEPLAAAQATGVLSSGLAPEASRS
jgi:uncharacterized membrane protein